MSNSLSMKTGNVRKRLARKKVGSDGYIAESIRFLVATRRDGRMIRRAQKGNNYAKAFCKRHGLKF